MTFLHIFCKLLIFGFCTVKEQIFFKIYIISQLYKAEQKTKPLLGIHDKVLCPHSSKIIMTVVQNITKLISNITKEGYLFQMFLNNE